MASANIPRIISINIDWPRIRQEASKLIGLLNEVAKIQREAEKKKKPGKRKNFSKKTKQLALIRQNYRCAKCCTRLKYRDFHHKKSKSDNDISNCEALCLDCHAEKTRKKSFWGLNIYLEALMLYFEIKDQENFDFLFQKTMSAIAKACLPLTYDFSEESIQKITMVRNEIEN